MEKKRFVASSIITEGHMSLPVWAFCNDGLVSSTFQQAILGWLGILLVISCRSISYQATSCAMQGPRSCVVSRFGYYPIMQGSVTTDDIEFSQNLRISPLQVFLNQHTWKASGWFDSITQRGNYPYCVAILLPTLEDHVLRHSTSYLISIVNPVYHINWYSASGWHVQVPHFPLFSWPRFCESISHARS